ncbi:extracellular solute-binding protein [Patescibacteria group bacterium]|nr:extracellular solute-binding protein [Patescibacteria group bacterium]
MKSSRFVLLTILSLTLTFSLMGLGCKGGDPEAQTKASTKITLNWWRINGQTSDFADLVKNYQQIHPNINIKVTVVPAQQLEQKLLEALAAGQGPDLVSLLNSHLGAWQDKMAPLPATLTLPFREMQGFIKKEPTWVMRSNATLNPKALPALYVDTVPQDVIINNQIYGLPLSVDSLVMYYNRDLLNVAQIATAPTTWTEFKTAVQKISLLDKNGKFIQHGAALGEADNLPYATDIVTALMLQNGTPMVNSQGSQAIFNQPVKSGDQQFIPGLDALRFYADFANPSKETYSWSRQTGDAWQTFASGKVGFIFGYFRDFKNLKQIAPKVNIGLASLPQIDDTTKPSNLANYYLETVPKQSNYQSEAWDFLQFVSKSNLLKDYLDKTKQPTAHRALLKEQLKDPDLTIAASQVLYSQNWYHGLKPEIMEGSLKAMIRQAVDGVDLEQALKYAASQISQTLQNRR